MKDTINTNLFLLPVLLSLLRLQLSLLLLFLLQLFLGQLPLPLFDDILLLRLHLVQGDEADRRALRAGDNLNRVGQQGGRLKLSNTDRFHGK